jgi:hypothetical protein
MQTRASLLPPPGIDGSYRYPDGCQIWKSWLRSGKWVAFWADKTPLTGVDPNSGRETKWYFDTAEEAAQALAEGDEGPKGKPPALSLCPTCGKPR